MPRKAIKACPGRGWGPLSLREQLCHPFFLHRTSAVHVNLLFTTSTHGPHWPESKSPACLQVSIQREKYKLKKEIYLPGRTSHFNRDYGFPNCCWGLEHFTKAQSRFHYFPGSHWGLVSTSTGADQSSLKSV